MMACALAGGGTAAGARDYYVSAKGDDANAGTAARPWRSIAKVNATALRPGDRVLFAGGERFAGTIRLDAKDSGTAQHKVVVTSYGRGRATIEAGNGAGLVAQGCSHLTVSNLNFAGAGRKKGNTENGVRLSDGKDLEVEAVDVSGFREVGLLVTGVRQARLTHVRAHDNGQAGIECGGGKENRWSEDVYIGRCVAENNPGNPVNLDNHSGNGIVVGYVKGCLIEYCEAMRNGWDMPRDGNGPVGIWAWNADRVVIQHCVAHHNLSPGWDGGGFDLDGGVTNSILQYNYSYENQGPGYFLCQYWPGPLWKDNIVRYNISVNDGWKTNMGAGIEVHAADVNISDAEVYNNTVYNTKGAAVGFSGNPVPGIRFRNNVFVVTGKMIKGDVGPTRFERNLYWPIGEGATFCGHPSLAEWAAATGQEKRNGKLVGLFADPRLVQAGAEPAIAPEKLTTLLPYRLRAGSPCLEAGLIITDCGGRDFWGRAVPARRRPSMGACQEAGK
jgi:hypothetical protein